MGLLGILIGLLLGLVLHEFMHGYAGFLLGDDTAQRQGRLTLNPLAHIDPISTLALPLFLILVHSPVVFAAAKPVPFRPWALRYGKWGAAIVGAAGPLTNFAIAILCALWLRFVPLGQTGVGLLVSIIEVNVALGVFNLIPFPPLDGSRILYAVVPGSVREVMDRIERAGIMAIFVFLFLLYPLISPLMLRAMQAILNLLVPGLTQF